MIRRIIICTLIAWIGLAGCAPSSAPTITPSAILSAIPSATPSTMPSPTSTTAPPPTSTPDLRVIDAHPESLIATLEDIALNASYSKDYWVEISIPDSLQSATHPDAYAWMEENNFVLGYKISNNAAEAGIPMRITIQLELFRDIVGASSMMLHWT